MAGFLCRVILAASLIGSFLTVGHAAPAVGKAVAVVQSASAKGSNGSRTLKAGMPISIGQRIKTGSTGQVQLVFTDDTKMVIGPNSSLVIEAYLLRSKKTVSKFVVKALGGSFRFITGKSPKKAYTIKTPAATIGVRGTSFDLTVGRRGDAAIVLFSGEADLCGKGGCVRLKDACSLANAPRNANVNMVRSRERRNRHIRARFPYIVSQAPLRRDFRISKQGCGNIHKVRLPEEPKITGSISPRVTAPPAPDPPDPPDPPGEQGNPGNGGTNGNAGASPGGNDMGDRERGRSDTNNGRGNDNGRGNNAGRNNG